MKEENSEQEIEEEQEEDIPPIQNASISSNSLFIKLGASPEISLSSPFETMERLIEFSLEIKKHFFNNHSNKKRPSYT